MKYQRNGIIYKNGFIKMRTQPAGKSEKKSAPYIENHFSEIVEKANVIEQRLDDSGLNQESLIAENMKNQLFVKYKKLIFFISVSLSLFHASGLQFASAYKFI